MIPTHELKPDGSGSFVAADLIRMEPVEGGGWHFRCLKDHCDFHREFGTLAGTRRYITEHMHLQHRVRVFWPAGA